MSKIRAKQYFHVIESAEIIRRINLPGGKLLRCLFAKKDLQRECSTQENIQRRSQEASQTKRA